VLQQKNIILQLGLQLLVLTTATRLLAGAGTQSAGLAIGGYVGTADTAATEEWTGAGAAVTKTITVS
jgi:hypothetical protein